MKPMGECMGCDWLEIKSFKKYGKNCASCRSARREAKVVARAKKRHERAIAIQEALKEVQE